MPKKLNPNRGVPLVLSTHIDPLPHARQGIRGICKDLVQRHTTDVAMRIREGMLSENLRLAHKYLLFVAGYESGKPVETHRMVALNEGPQGAYDMSKLSAEERAALIKLLKKSKDATQPVGDADDKASTDK